mmetsp:Transcript_14645/g.27506  ORF Transcript_14645/g.27506 Transcript_14645/m.27506 type:complete len:279 (+) Transcript_14645:130-966(+)
MCWPFLKIWAASAAALASKVCENVDDQALLQRHQETLQQEAWSGGHVASDMIDIFPCLKFIHIPKTGGTSIETVLWNQSAKLSPRTHSWGMFDSKLDCLHKNVGNASTGCQLQNGYCAIWHIPPAADVALLKSYQQCDTFCVVRNPLTRLMSEFRYETFSCDRDGFEKWATSVLDSAERGVSMARDCHLIPQHHFVWANGDPRKGPKTCSHVLRYENLTAEFNELMIQKNIPLVLDRYDQPIDRPVRTCAEREFEPSAELANRVRAAFAADYALFGYA